MATQPNVENLRKQAKSLHKQLRAGDADSVARIRKGLPRLSETADADVSGAGVTLQEVQHVIAWSTASATGSSWQRPANPRG